MGQWKSDEIAILKNFYPLADYSTKTIAELLNRSESSIRCKAVSLNITRGTKRWKQDYDEFLELNYKKLGIRECAKYLGYTEWHIQRKARQLGLTKESTFWTKKELERLKELATRHFSQAEIATELNKTIIQVKNKMRISGLNNSWWTDDEILFLRANYNSHNADAIASHLNRSKKTIYRKASLLGLTKKDNSGRNHYAFIEDLRAYPAEWTPELRRLIRRRDGNRCQVCWRSQKDEGRDLQIHHIDYNKENCMHENLITLCMGCHVKTNINREQWQLFFNSLARKS